MGQIKSTDVFDLANLVHLNICIYFQHLKTGSLLHEKKKKKSLHFQLLFKRLEAALLYPTWQHN